MTPEQIDHALALLTQPKASVKATANLLGVFRSTLYTPVPQLAAIRAKARTDTAAVVPAPRPPITRDPGAWWKGGDFTLDHISTGWQLTHPRYPAGPGEAIPCWPPFPPIGCTPGPAGQAPPPRRYRRVIAVDGKTLDRLLVLAPTMATATRLSPTAESTSRHRATGH